MNVSRFVSFAAAVVISATQWTAVFSPALNVGEIRKATADRLESILVEGRFLLHEELLDAGRTARL